MAEEVAQGRAEATPATSPGALRSAFVLVLVLVLERCCLQERRVNPIRSAFPELHPRSGLMCS